MSLNGKQVAIVTGAASGIGRAIALAFAENQYRVFLFDKDGEALHRSLEEFGDKPVVTYCGDVSASKDVKEALAKCLTEFGRVDVLVSNVGVLHKKAFLDMDEELWDRELAVNLKGVFLWGQAVAKWMVENNIPGAIINISCIRTELVTPNMSAYSASKGGVKAFVVFSKAVLLAVETALEGVDYFFVAVGWRTLSYINYQQIQGRQNNRKNHQRKGDFQIIEVRYRVTVSSGKPCYDYICGCSDDCAIPA